MPSDIYQLFNSPFESLKSLTLAGEAYYWSAGQFPHCEPQDFLPRPYNITNP